MPIYIPITETLKSKLVSERKRTGVGPTALMRGTAHDANRPSKLKGHTISLWLSGKIISTRQSQLDYVFARWAALPDRSASNARRPQERIMLSDEHLHMIDTYWDVGLLPNKILGKGDTPEGLNAAIIRTWKDRRIKTAAKAYLDFVMHQCSISFKTR